MRWFFLLLFAATVSLAVGIGPRGEKFTEPPLYVFPDMDWQYKVKAQKPSEFFADGSGSRRPVDHTIPIGYNAPVSKDDRPVGGEYYLSGTFGDFFGEGIPEELTVDDAFLERGHQRYQIYCTACHGSSGNGEGVVSRFWGQPPTRKPGQPVEEFAKELAAHKGIPPTANLIDPRVTAMPDGQIFWTITHGKGLMGPYNGAINVEDRWAITAYVRALQAAGSGAQ